MAAPTGRQDGLHPAVGPRGADSRPVRNFPAPRLHLRRERPLPLLTTEVHMLKSLIAGCAVAGMLGLSACSGMGRGETVGTVGGAAAGGAVGSAVTGGSTLGTLGGAALGGYAGHEAGANYDKKHQ